MSFETRQAVHGKLQPAQTGSRPTRQLADQAAGRPGSWHRQGADIDRGLGASAGDELGPAPAPARPQRPVAIVGGGSIGVGWAVVFARGQQQVNVFEPGHGRRELFPGELRRRLEALAESGLIEEDVNVVADRVQLGADLPGAVGSSFYVQECSPEDADVKRSVFESLDRHSSSDAVLASSSSALLASEIARGLSCAPRCLIAHPGNPPYLLPVVELVPAPFTDPAIVETADAFLRSVGMIPARLGRELEGFVFNRLQGAVLREAYCLVRDSVATPEDIDIVMREGLGRRWSVLGPFEVAELNTRGGIDAHALVMGPAYARMGAERGQSDPWTDDLVATVSEAVQRRFPRERWEDHVAWRDQALMAMEACRRAKPIVNGPPSQGSRARRSDASSGDQGG